RRQQLVRIAQAVETIQLHTQQSHPGASATGSREQSRQQSLQVSPVGQSRQNIVVYESGLALIEPAAPHCKACAQGPIEHRQQRQRSHAQGYESLLAQRDSLESLGCCIAAGLAAQFLHACDQRRWLNVERLGQLAQGREGRLADTALHLAHERTVDVGAQGERLL